MTMDTPGIVAWLAGGYVPHRRHRRAEHGHMVNIEAYGDSSDGEPSTDSRPGRLAFSRERVKPPVKPQQVAAATQVHPSKVSETAQAAKSTKAAVTNREPEPEPAKLKNLRFHGSEKSVSKPMLKSAMKKKTSSEGKDLECHCWCEVCVNCRWSTKARGADEDVEAIRHCKHSHGGAPASAGQLHDGLLRRGMELRLTRFQDSADHECRKRDNFRYSSNECDGARFTNHKFTRHSDDSDRDHSIDHRSKSFSGDSDNRRRSSQEFSHTPDESQIRYRTNGRHPSHNSDRKLHKHDKSSRSTDDSDRERSTDHKVKRPSGGSDNTHRPTHKVRRTSNHSDYRQRTNDPQSSEYSDRRRPTGRKLSRVSDDSDSEPDNLTLNNTNINKQYNPKRSSKSHPPYTHQHQDKMPRFILPSRSEVLMLVDVIEGPNDPRPNAFYDVRTKTVQVYHGPFYGNPDASPGPAREHNGSRTGTPQRNNPFGVAGGRMHTRRHMSSFYDDDEDVYDSGIETEWSHNQSQGHHGGQNRRQRQGQGQQPRNPGQDNGGRSSNPPAKLSNKQQTKQHSQSKNQSNSKGNNSKGNEQAKKKQHNDHHIRPIWNSNTNTWEAEDDTTDDDANNTSHNMPGGWDNSDEDNLSSDENGNGGYGWDNAGDGNYASGRVSGWDTATTVNEKNNNWRDSSAGKNNAGNNNRKNSKNKADDSKNNRATKSGWGDASIAQTNKAKGKSGGDGGRAWNNAAASGLSAGSWEHDMQRGPTAAGGNGGGGAWESFVEPESGW